MSSYRKSYAAKQISAASATYRRAQTALSRGTARMAQKDHKRLQKVYRTVQAARNSGYCDTGTTLTSLSTSGLIYSVFYVPTNADTAAPYRRIGDSVTITRIRLSVVCKGANDGALLAADFYNNIGMRFGILKNPHGQGLPQFAVNSKVSLTDLGGSASQDANALMPPIGFDLEHNFRTLVEKTFSVVGLDTAAPNYTAEHTKTYFRDFKGLNIKTTFSSTTNSPSSFETNMPVLVFNGDSSTSPNPAVSYMCRIYYDM